MQHTMIKRKLEASVGKSLCSKNIWLITVTLIIWWLPGKVLLGFAIFCSYLRMEKKENDNHSNMWVEIRPCNIYSYSSDVSNW